MDEVIDKPAPGRREQRKAERRAAIVAVATRSFMDRGYAGTTLSAIADTMGGSKGTLWSYFSSKEELFAAVVDTAAGSFRASVTPILNDRDGAIGDALAGFVELFIALVTSPDSIALQRLIIGEAGRASEVGAIFYDRAPARTQALMTDYLARQMDAGRLRRDDPADAADVLLRLCGGGLQERILWGVDTPAPDAIEREAAFVVKHFLAVYAC